MQLPALVTALAAAAALVFTAQELSATREALTISNEGQVTDRFSTAVEQISSDSIVLRLGGVYALERIGKDSARDYLATMDVLTAFLRQRTGMAVDSEAASSCSNRTGPPAVDVQAALDVIARRDISKDPPPNPEVERDWSWNLSGLCIPWANLRGASLERIDFSSSNLDCSTLNYSSLRGTYLGGASLRQAFMRNTDLTRANLSQADLSGTSMPGVIMSETSLYKTVLHQANLFQVQISNVSFQETDLTYSGLSSSSIEDSTFATANLDAALLFGNDLQDVSGLPPEASQSYGNVDRRIDGPSLGPSCYP
jgi:hypothetical protein